MRESVPPDGPASVVEVPPTVLARADVRQVLADHDFGQLFALVRQRSGISYSRIAAACDIKPERVGTLARGIGEITSMNKIIQIADGLRIPGHLLGLLPRPWEASHPAQPPVSLATERTADTLAASATTSLDLARGLVDSTDDEVVELLTAELQRVAAAYVHQPLPRLIGHLVAVRDRAAEHLHSGTRPRHARHLLLIIGAACALLGHAAHDQGATSTAVTHLAATRAVADHAEHAPLAAAAHTLGALVADWMPHPRAAIQRAQTALDLHPSGPTAVRAAVIQARAAARSGNYPQAHTAIKWMHRLIEQPTHEEDMAVAFGGVFAFPLAKQAYYQGSVYLLLGDSHAAAELSHRAVESYTAGPAEERSYGDEALARVTLIASLVRLGDVDTAEDQLDQLRQWPTDLRIHQLNPAIDELRALLARIPTPAARAMNDQLYDYHMLGP